MPIEIDPIILAVLGVVAPFLIAVAERAKWSSRTKFWVAVAMSAALVVIVWLTVAFPESWQQVAAQIAVVFTICQLVYRALKPTGVFTWITDQTTPGKHAAQDARK